MSKKLTCHGCNEETILVSIVTPAHNEERNIVPLYDEIVKVMAKRQFSWELIIVDDGSIDGTVEKVQTLKKMDSRVKLVRLTRNFGHQPALLAGFSVAKGASVISLDADLQHPPRFISKMLDSWIIGGNLVVQMIRKRTEGVGFIKRLSSAFFYWLINKLSAVHIIPGAADFQLLDRIVVDNLLSLRDSEPFIRGTVSWLGYRTDYMFYVADPRYSGAPSYTFLRSLRLAGAALTISSNKPLQLGFYIGAFTALVCLIYLVFIFVSFIKGNTVPGWASLAGTVLFLGAVQLIVIGIIGQYLLKVFERTRNLPTYVIDPIDSDLS